MEGDCCHNYLSLFLEILASVIRQVVETRSRVSFKEKIEYEVKTTDYKYNEIKHYVLKLKKKITTDWETVPINMMIQ